VVHDFGDVAGVTYIVMELVRGQSLKELIAHGPLTPARALDLSPDDLEPCDAAFIDGDHGLEAVMHDTMLARSLVRPGGIIIWHDYHDLGVVDVKAALDGMHRAGDAIYRVDDTWLAFERRPPADA